MKKLKIDAKAIQKREEKPHLDSIDELLAEEHYGKYVVIKKKEQRVSQRMYLSFSHHLEYYKKRKELGIENRGNEPKEYEYHLFTKYPENKAFISDVLLHILPTRKEYARTQSILIALGSYVEIMLKNNIKMNNFDDIKTEHQRLVWESLKNNHRIEMLSLFFSAIASISDKFRWQNPTKKRNSKNIKALETTVIYQIDRYAKLQIKEIMARRKEYLGWTNEYAEKDLFSLENLAHTYYSYLKKHGNNSGGRIIILRKLSITLYNVDLKSWKHIIKGKHFYIDKKQEQIHLELQELATQGIDIWIQDERMFALWYSELCPDFPFNKEIQPKYKEVYTNIHKYTGLSY